MIKISVVTITYNSERTITDTFESMLKQKYRPLEYLVVDGGSQDGTLSIINDYSKRFKDAGIEFSYKSEKDKGISDAFNKGIDRSTGEIIGIINSDDMLYDGALEHIANCYDEETDVYYGDCIVFNDSNNDHYIVYPKHDLERLKGSMCIYHPSTFVTKRAYEQFGKFKTNLKYCMDRELLLRFYVNGCKFKYIPQRLACYREGGVNQTNYRKNVDEGTRISIEYGMKPFYANLMKIKKVIKYTIWRWVQKNGMEKYFHKKQ